MLLISPENNLNPITGKSKNHVINLSKNNHVIYYGHGIKQTAYARTEQELLNKVTALIRSGYNHIEIYICTTIK
jgi:hypothetical protein